MTRTIKIEADKLKVGDLLWLRDRGGKRIVEVEPLPDAQCFYGRQRRWRFRFEDGTAWRNSNTHDVVNIVIPDLPAGGTR